MKIREVMDKKIGDKKYTRFIVAISKEDVEKSKLIGKELEVFSKEGEIKLKKRKV